MPKQYEVHPAAKAFPMMSPAELEGLKSDIEQNGQTESIVVWNGLLVDGRNRLKACELLGIEPRACELMEETDPVAYVISANLHRRQLHPSQRAMIAAKMATLRNGQRKGASSNDLAQQDAAHLLSVSAPQVKRAKYVLESGSQALIDAVEQRDVTVSMAEKLCKSCPDKREQSKLVKEGKKAIAEFLNPTPVDADEPEGDDVGDKYEYQIVHMFKHADYRLNTFKKLVGELTETEVTLVREWLKEPPCPSR